MKEQILDDDIISKQKNIQVLEKFQWWERKRLIFNIAVGLTGLLVTIIYCRHWGGFELFGVVTWAIVANILYSAGFIIEMMDFYYLNESLKIEKLRMFFFLVGTFCYVIVSYFFGMAYYIFNH